MSQSPGKMVLPVASITSAFSGIDTPPSGPTRAIRFADTTIVVLGIVRAAGASNRRQWVKTSSPLGCRASVWAHLACMASDRRDCSTSKALAADSHPSRMTIDHSEPSAKSAPSSSSQIGIGVYERPEISYCVTERVLPSDLTSSVPTRSIAALPPGRIASVLPGAASSAWASKPISAGTPSKLR